MSKIVVSMKGKLHVSGPVGVVATDALVGIDGGKFSETYEDGSGKSLVNVHASASAALDSVSALFVILSIKVAAGSLRADLIDANGATILSDAATFDAVEQRIRAAWGI